MGLLPGARTVTLVPGDPFPAALGDELQDQIIGAKRKAWGRPFYPRFLSTTNLTLNTTGLTGPPAETYTSSGVATGVFEVPFEEGDRIIALKYWAFGNGVTDLSSGRLEFFAGAPDALATNVISWNDSNRPAAWTFFDTATIGTFFPLVLTAGGILRCLININAAGYQFGWWQASFDRL